MPGSYVVTSSPSDPKLADVCAAVYDALGDAARTASVDAYSDFSARMPPDVVAAEAWLRRRGLDQGRRDPGIGVEVSREDEVGWSIARAYTPWSIHTQVIDSDGANLATFHDSGCSIIATLDPVQVAELTDRLPDAHSLEPLLLEKERRPEAVVRSRPLPSRVRKALRFLH